MVLGDLMFIDILVILISGYLAGKLFEFIKMPKLLGYLFVGILFQYFGFISTDLLLYKKQITTFALSIILLKAGLGIDAKTIKKVGNRALLLGFIPNLFEATVILLMGMLLLDLSFIEAGMVAFIISPVSPAVVIPSMVSIKEKGYNKNGVPVMNLASASIDDVFSVLMFSIFLFLYAGNLDGNQTLIMWPLIYLVIMIAGFFLQRFNIKPTVDKIWDIAQIYLFFIIGFMVNLNTLGNIGLISIFIIIIGLLLRFMGVITCLKGSVLDNNEKTFCVIANTPKATVQASLGAIPLIYGVASGELILAMSTLSIILTAPIGLILIEKFTHKLLKKGSI